jgi:hypothetical protein
VIVRDENFHMPIVVGASVDFVAAKL